MKEVDRDAKTLLEKLVEGGKNMTDEDRRVQSRNYAEALVKTTGADNNDD